MIPVRPRVPRGKEIQKEFARLFFLALQKTDFTGPKGKPGIFQDSRLLLCRGNFLTRIRAPGLHRRFPYKPAAFIGAGGYRRRKASGMLFRPLTIAPHVLSKGVESFW